MPVKSFDLGFKNFKAVKSFSVSSYPGFVEVSVLVSILATLGIDSRSTVFLILFRYYRISL